MEQMNCIFISLSVTWYIFMCESEAKSILYMLQFRLFLQTVLSHTMYVLQMTAKCIPIYFQSAVTAIIVPIFGGHITL